MKKLVSILLSLILSIITASTVNAFATQGDYCYDADTVFLNFLDEIETKYGYAYDNIDWQKEDLYNLKGDVSGNLFEFCLDGNTYGYMIAVVFKANGITYYEKIEHNFETKSPYYGEEGIKLYPTFCTYILKKENTYYNLKEQKEISEQDVQALEEKGFGFSGGECWEDPITIYYHHKTDVWQGIQIKAPTYDEGTDLGPNDCAVKAGANAVGYWDKAKANLIPDWVPGNFLFGIYFWRGQDDPVDDASDDLYVYMGTNQSGPGTTVTGFKNGLITYANNHGGYGVTYRSVMSGGSYNLSLIASEFANGRPVAIFLWPYYNLIPDGFLATYSGYDYIGKLNYEAAHVVLAWGIRTIHYYNAYNELIDYDIYLTVSTGYSGENMGFLRLTDDYCSINDAFSIQIS